MLIPSNTLFFLLSATPSAAFFVGPSRRSFQPRIRYPSQILRSSSPSTYEPNIPYDENPPLAKGIDSVEWMEPVDVTARRESTKEFLGQGGGAAIAPLSSPTSEILPLFPLGGMVYTPHTSHVLNIFEPRYRSMYNDILLNGTRRFVVSMSHPEKQGCFASTGVVFYLKDLKEVSQQTDDQIKYICEHMVIGRVKMENVLNPSVWKTRDTYLKVGGSIVKEEGDEVSIEEQETPDENVLTDIYTTLKEWSLEPDEASLKRSFEALVELQHELSEDVRFTKKSVPSLGVRSGGGKGSLWSSVRLWQSYTEQRLVGRQNELQIDFQEKLVKFLTEEKNVKEDELPSAIGFSDLSPQLQKDVQDLQNRISDELEPLVLESTLAMQKILEASDHLDRAKLLRYFVDSERKRLEAKKMLQNMFQEETSSDRLESEDPATKPDAGVTKLPDEDVMKDDVGGVDFSADDDGFQ